MSDSIAPTVDDVITSIRSFILGVLPVPDGSPQIEVVQGLQNRVAMPQNPFVLITPLFMARLEWNHKRYRDNYPDASSEVDIFQPTQMDLQLDCYGPMAADWAAMLSTLFFDETACDSLAALGNVCQPLYVNGPHLMPMVDGEMQYQSRWRLTLAVQYNSAVTQLQQFFDKLHGGLIDVDVVFPSSDMSSGQISIDSSTISIDA